MSERGVRSIAVLAATGKWLSSAARPVREAVHELSQ
jgi:hypothetical protein